MRRMGGGTRRTEHGLAIGSPAVHVAPNTLQVRREWGTILRCRPAIRRDAVHGSTNVYVADASLHPTNGGFNPGLTAMACAFVADLML